MKKIKVNEEFQMGDTVFKYSLNNGAIAITVVRRLEASKTTGVKPGFVPPTLKEVEDYFKQKGYSQEAAGMFHEYYKEGDWHDGAGKPIKNWKQKALSVWFKPENKAKEPVNKPDSVFKFG